MRRRRMYSDSGMPASDENIRRRWYSVVPTTARQAGDVDLIGEVLLDEIDEPVECCDHGSPFDIKPAAWPRPSPDYRGPMMS